MTSSSSPGVQNEERRTSDFSIDHILNRAGSSSSRSFGNFENFVDCGNVPFTWLQCSRYCPPKVPRKREGPQKRQLGRHPRIPFTSQQLAILEERFHQSPYLSSEEVTRLSAILHLADIRVKIWFQNRRARERREKHQPENRTPPIVMQPCASSSSSSHQPEPEIKQENNSLQPWYS